MPDTVTGLPDLRISSWAKFESPELESRYREHVRPQDIRQAYAALWAGIVISLAFITTDYQILSQSSFRVLLAGRLALTVLSIGIIFLFRREQTPMARTCILFGWVACGAVLMAGIGWSRSSEYFPGQVLMVNFILLLVYLVVPLTLMLQIVGALLFTVADLYQLLTRHMDINPIVVRAMLVTYLLTNLMGAITSRSRHRLKREEFVLLQREVALRGSLEEALAEVKTLRGILSICSHCKKIRNQQGIWEPIDRYVMHNSEAEFSHDICPECLEPLMRGLR